MASTWTINGSSVTLESFNAIPVRCTPWIKDGTPTLEIQRRGIILPGLPDPWLGKTVTWTYGGTLYFSGIFIDIDMQFEERGWVFTYRAVGLRWLGDTVPVTDDNTTADTMAFNLPSDDPNYIASRSGRTVGQILTTVLTQTTNATRLNNLGIGQYTSMSPPTLPTATVNDLAALTWQPPYPVYVAGEKIFNAIQGFLSGAAPNHTVWVQPDGTIRFLDTRSFPTSTLTLGTDPIDPPQLKRSIMTSFSRVIVRGQPLIESCMLSLVNGGLAEDFAHDGLSNSAAKTAWKLTDFKQTQNASDWGTCTCPNTTTVTVTSHDNTRTWPLDYWDQVGSDAHGVIYLYYSAGTGVTQSTSRRMTANTALVAAGTSNVTVDSALPITNYDSYQIYGQQQGGSIVWRRYSIVNTAIAAALANYFNYPQPWINSDGTTLTLTMSPTASVVWQISGTTGYFEATAGFTQDPTSGTITFMRPVVEFSESDQTKLMSGSGYNTPYDIRVLLAVNKGALTSTQPPDSGGPVYTGTCNSDEGVQRTLYVMVPAWRDPSNQSNMDTYCSHVLDSVKDTVVEGTLTYFGMYTAALTPGVSLNIPGHLSGSAVTTGLESIALPIYQTDITWPQQGANQIITQMHLSNRRAQFTGSLFTRPAQTGLLIGSSSGTFMANPSGATEGELMAMLNGAAQQ